MSEIRSSSHDIEPEATQSDIGALFNSVLLLHADHGLEAYGQEVNLVSANGELPDGLAKLAITVSEYEGKRYASITRHTLKPELGRHDSVRSEIMTFSFLDNDEVSMDYIPQDYRDPYDLDLENPEIIDLSEIDFEEHRQFVVDHSRLSQAECTELRNQIETSIPRL